jgi:nitroreductase/NAD-dependent dihydropyrimidine dehydrogenase PreA subunit
MQKSVTTIIDQDSCIGCGLCVKVCPAETIIMHNGKATVTGSYSMACGHCQAVCPVGAIRVEALEDPFTLKSTTIDPVWLAPGDCDAGQFVRLLLSRRSCRNYKNKEIDPAILEDLVKAGTTAPSGTNSQLWTFTVLSSRREVVALGAQVARFFQRLNKMAARPWLRLFARIFVGDGLGQYYRTYFDTVQTGLRLWHEEHIDTLFHGAVAAILVGGKDGASTPMEDALLASQNILLAAHCFGLGSCMIGFAVEAVKRDKQIRKMLDIPGDESVYAVIALGYPDEKYKKIALRKKAVPRYPLR